MSNQERLVSYKLIYYVEGEKKSNKTTKKNQTLQLRSQVKRRDWWLSEAGDEGQDMKKVKEVKKYKTLVIKNLLAMREIQV